MSRKVIQEFIIPKGTGKGFIVKKGQVLRVIELGGGQVGEIMFFNQQNHKEVVSGGISPYLNNIAAFGGSPLQMAGRVPVTKLYSKVPFENVRLTVIDDKVGQHCVGRHCSRKAIEIWAKEGLVGPDRRSCTDNFIEALRDFGISPEDLDTDSVFNIFKKEVIDEEGTLHVVSSPAKDGDYIDFLAEIDVLVGFSCCSAPPPINAEELRDMKIQILE